MKVQEEGITGGQNTNSSFKTTIEEYAELKGPGTGLVAIAIQPLSSTQLSHLGTIAPAI